MASTSPSLGTNITNLTLAEVIKSGKDLNREWEKTGPVLATNDKWEKKAWLGEGRVTIFSEVKEHSTKSEKYIYLCGQ